VDKNEQGAPQNESLDQKESDLKERLERIRELEQEILQRESEVKNREKARKSLLLRLAPTLWESIARWAEEDYRSINGQIEYILSQAVKEHYR